MSNFYRNITRHGLVALSCVAMVCCSEDSKPSYTYALVVDLQLNPQGTAKALILNVHMTKDSTSARGSLGEKEVVVEVCSTNASFETDTLVLGGECNDSFSTRLCLPIYGDAGNIILVESLPDDALIHFRLRSYRSAQGGLLPACNGTILDQIVWDNSTVNPKPLCGNEAIDSSEVCDGTRVGAATCLTQGFVGGGTLTCLPDCSGYNTSACSNCGNDAMDTGETCDGSLFGGSTCESVGFGGGTLACAADCLSFDTANCSN